MTGVGVRAPGNGGQTEERRGSPLLDQRKGREGRDEVAPNAGVHIFLAEGAGSQLSPKETDG